MSNDTVDYDDDGCVDMQRVIVFVSEVWPDKKVAIEMMTIFYAAMLGGLSPEIVTQHLLKITLLLDQFSEIGQVAPSVYSQMQTAARMKGKAPCG